MLYLRVQQTYKLNHIHKIIALDLPSISHVIFWSAIDDYKMS